MTTLSERYLKTGGDPRTLADYAALRSEMNKLTHPARPDVNWQQAEKHCLSLFEHNGVELQTAAWYTLARTHQSGLSGLNEGLVILTELVTRQWSNLWPQPVHARMDILGTLSKRLRQVLRSQPPGCDNISHLNQAEEYLHLLDEALQRLELTPFRQLDTLRDQIHSTLVRVGKSDTRLDTAVAAPVKSSNPTSGIPAEKNDYAKRVYVPEPEALPEVVTAYRLPAKRWKPFAAGMMTMLVLAGTIAGGWLVIHQPDLAQEQSAAMLSPLLTTLSADQGLTHPSSETGIHQTQQQLAQLLQLKPDWAVSYGDSLVQQALMQWPEQGKPLAQQWQRHKAAIALAPENLTGWHQGVAQLEQLANRLNALDEQKGKYMTVSELKSAVFSIMQSLNRTVPVEEQLRQLSDLPAEQDSNAVRQRQVEQHLQQLIASYAALKQTPTK